MGNAGFDKESSQAVKGIAIVMMLYHHSFRHSGLFEKYLDHLSFAPLRMDQVMTLAEMCKICVSIFAFITGYGLYLNYRKKGKLSDNRWVLLRYIRTFSGYWFVFILSAAFCYFMDKRFPSLYLTGSLPATALNVTLDFFGLSTLFGTPCLNGAWWYMSAAAVFIVLIPLILKLENQIFVVLAFVVAFPRIIADAAGGGAYLGGNAPYSFIFVLMLGMIFAKYRLFERIFARGGRARVIRFVVEVLLLAFSYKLYKSISNKMHWEIMWGLIPVLVILFFTEFVVRIPGLRKVLVILGKHSMNMFLVHLFIRMLYFTDFTYSFGHFALDTAVLVLTSFLVSVGIELLKKAVRWQKMVDAMCSAAAR